MEKSDKRITELVDRASNGQDALDIVKNASKIECFYSVIFMDCSMPIMDGYESTKLIRQYYKKNKI